MMVFISNDKLRREIENRARRLTHDANQARIDKYMEVIKMVKADFSGNFVNADNAKENDVLEILGEGEYEERESSMGKKYRSLNLPCKVNDGRELTFTPSIDCGKKLVEVWGSETSNWVGKKGTIKHVRYKSFGDTKIGIEIEPIAD